MCEHCDAVEALVDKMCLIGSGNYQELTWEQRKEYRVIWEQVLSLRMEPLGGRDMQAKLVAFLKQPTGLLVVDMIMDPDKAEAVIILASYGAACAMMAWEDNKKRIEEQAAMN